MASKHAFVPIRILNKAPSVLNPHRIHLGPSFSICTSCRRSLLQQQQHNLRDLSISSSQHRTFTTSLQHRKNSSKGRKGGKADNEEHIPDNKVTRNQRDTEIDPYDHSELEAGITSAIARLKESLSKTRDAGRVTVEMLENLPVELNIKNPDQSKPKGKAESPHHESTKLGHIASVVPKGGRTLQIFAAEQGHIKPLTAAVAGSAHSLNPEIDKQNPLLILVPVPPVTAETRAQAAAEAKKCFDRASLDVRNARGDAQKWHRKMEKDKLVIKDELVKAHKSMEEVARKGQEEVKKVYDGALKALQG